MNHEVRTTTDKPVRIAPRQLPYSMVETVKDEIKKIFKLKNHRAVRSPNLSPFVLVVKKKLHVDFHSLNKITLFDAEPMPK